MSASERLEAIGPRGEACIIIRTPAQAALEGGATSVVAQQFTYRLATGEQLLSTEDERVFETRTGARRYKLR